MHWHIGQKWRGDHLWLKSCHKTLLLAVCPDSKRCLTGSAFVLFEVPLSRRSASLMLPKRNVEIIGTRADVRSFSSFDVMRKFTQILYICLKYLRPLGCCCYSVVWCVFWTYCLAKWVTWSNVLIYNWLIIIRIVALSVLLNCHLSDIILMETSTHAMWYCDVDDDEKVVTNVSHPDTVPAHIKCK